MASDVQGGVDAVVRGLAQVVVAFGSSPVAVICHCGSRAAGKVRL